MEAAETIRQWLKATMAEKGLTPAGWARAAGIAPSTVQRALKDDYAFVTSSRTLAKLAAAAKVDPPDVISSSGDPRVVPRYLPVRFCVQAGHWFEVGYGVEEPAESYSAPVLPNPRFADWPQWLERVVGDSVNLKYGDGAFVHVVDAIEMGYQPTDGHFVVVERRRDGGHIRERTIKQIEIRDGAVLLWPRSTNARWQEPVNLTNGAREGEDVEVEVVGLVIGSYTSDY